MAKKWRDLYNKLPADARAEIEARVAATLKEMPLQDLRRARQLSQVRLAETLDVAQSEVSKIEHRTDLYISTLRSYIEAMGGELEILARFPDGAAVRITQFEALEEKA
jgi:transcriptional regulator with XRE-family HTH domain